MNIGLPVKGYLMLLVILAAAPAYAAFSCADAPAAWIFCDDFESGAPLANSYFEYDNDGGDFVVVDGVGTDGGRGMRALFQTGEQSAGSLKKSFGRIPGGYLGQNASQPTQDFQEIYWKYDIRAQPGWQGQPFKMTRATGFWSGDWSQFMIAHIWNDTGLGLAQDPVRCVDVGTNQPKCVGYNDFPNMDWIGNTPGTTDIYDPGETGQWFCLEHRVRLNTPGANDGVFQTRIDGVLEMDQQTLNWRGTYTGYGINAILLENYWNTGSVQEQGRYFDNFVISTEPIGCGPPVSCCSDVPFLSLLTVGNDVRLDWTVPGGSSTFDVVLGDLGVLRQGAGDFSLATTQCVANGQTGNSLQLSNDPAAGQGSWFLVGAADPGGTYDSLSVGQVGQRDAEIAASPGACP